MKHLVVLILLNAVVAAQSPKYEWAKKPVKDGVFVHLIDEPVKIYINKGSVHAWGVWVAVDSSSGPAGPSISDIYCTSSDSTCHEQMANIVPLGDEFSLQQDSADYRVKRWNDSEIVAENEDIQAPILAGPCHLLGVLKIDLSHQKVYAYQTLVEPPTAGDAPPNPLIDSKKFCESANNTLWELHKETMFSISPGAKTLTPTGQK
jgi:hypothetical protein